MTIEEVRAVITDAKPPTHPADIVAGPKERLRIDDVTLVDEHFRVSFYFDEEKLVQVSLILEGEPSAIQARAIEEKLAKLLRTKYGDPKSTNSQSVGYVREKSTTWLSDQTDITLQMITIVAERVDFDELISLKINYRAILNRDLEKI